MFTCKDQCWYARERASGRYWVHTSPRSLSEEPCSPVRHAGTCGGTTAQKGRRTPCRQRVGGQGAACARGPDDQGNFYLEPYANILLGSSLTVSAPILRSNTRLKVLDKIYHTDILFAILQSWKFSKLSSSNLSVTFNIVLVLPKKHQNSNP